RIRLSDLPDYVLGGGVASGAGAGGAVADAARDTQDLPLKDAKEHWMSVLEASYLRDLLGTHGGNVSAAAKAAASTARPSTASSTSTASSNLRGACASRAERR